MNNNQSNSGYTARLSLIVALGGFLMGFDASVISGVVGFIETEFSLTKIQLGWSVASLALTASLGMLISGPLSDRIGRKPVLKLAALLFLVSALASALAPNFTLLVIARLIGGLGVGAALIIAPMYIAEIAPASQRGRLVSFNQLNIVIGISVAFFSNYLILQLGKADALITQVLQLDELAWRWMLGVEALPALLYLLFLRIVPESPRWLVMQNRQPEATEILNRVQGSSGAQKELANIQNSLRQKRQQFSRTDAVKALFGPSMRLVLTIGLSVAVLQQITGINSVFFYAPMIFEQSGIGTDASFMQAVLVGLTNLIFTLVALALIDKLGRKPLLGVGVLGIAGCMFLLAWSFHTATYQLTADNLAAMPIDLPAVLLLPLQNVLFEDDLGFKAALSAQLGPELTLRYESELIQAAANMNSGLILLAILGFVASFAVSLGPVMWVLFSEIFPNHIRGLAISFVGLVNSGVSFTVQLVFPWQLATLGSALTFLIYGLFAVIGLLIILKLLPETRGRSLEELEEILIK